MVTAETALALPALGVVLVLAVSVVSAMAAQVRCIDAAREGARAAARGDEPGTARATALRVAPNGAHAWISVSGELVTVRVSAQVPLLTSLMPAIRVDASAVTAREDTP